MMSIDFRMTSTTLVSDVVLPAATWYEKADLSSTDMHPYVHAFSPAIDPPWETRSDFDAFGAIARPSARMAKTHLGTRTDVVLTALQHDTPDAMAYPDGTEHDWRTRARRRCRADDGQAHRGGTRLRRIDDKWPTLGPLVDKFGLTTKGVTAHPFREVDELRRQVRGAESGVADGPPGDHHGRRGWPTSSWRCRARRTGGWRSRGSTNWRSAPASGWCIWPRAARTSASPTPTPRRGPVPVITSPEWSGSETGGRRYAPFTVNIEELKPFHTLTGRMHFYLDHDWLEELGEHLPMFRPPLDMARLFGEPAARLPRAASG